MAFRYLRVFARVACRFLSRGGVGTLFCVPIKRSNILNTPATGAIRTSLTGLACYCRGKVIPCFSSLPPRLLVRRLVAYRAMQALKARFIDCDVAGKPLGSIELSASNMVTKMPAGKDPKAAFAFGVCSNFQPARSFLKFRSFYVITVSCVFLHPDYYGR